MNKPTPQSNLVVLPPILLPLVVTVVLSLLGVLLWFPWNFMVYVWTVNPPVAAAALAGLLTAGFFISRLLVPARADFYDEWWTRGLVAVVGMLAFSLALWSWLSWPNSLSLSMVLNGAGILFGGGIAVVAFLILVFSFDPNDNNMGG